MLSGLQVGNFQKIYLQNFRCQGVLNNCSKYVTWFNSAVGVYLRFYAILIITLQRSGCAGQAYRLTNAPSSRFPKSAGLVGETSSAPILSGVFLDYLNQTTGRQYNRKSSQKPLRSLENTRMHLGRVEKGTKWRFDFEPAGVITIPI